MPVQLPALPRLATVKPRYIDFATDMTPFLGGPTQRIARLGSRYAMDVALPQLQAAQARAWIAARLKARVLGQTLIMDFPQADGAGDLLAPLVNAGGQAGATLNAKGLRHYVTVKAGSFFSFIVSGRNYLHCVTDDVVADGSGHAALSIAPLLRISPADGAVLQFAAPQIEGFLAGVTEDWDLNLMMSTVGAGFTIGEVE